ncbi:LINE-1 retrotransposable element ORF1 protein [Plecturocebus cupreus]
MKMGNNQCKKTENSKNQNTSYHSKDHNSVPAREQSWTKNEFDELTGVITSELKEHVLTQCKEAKNHENRLDEFLIRITSLEKNINDLMELKNTA